MTDALDPTFDARRRTICQVLREARRATSDPAAHALIEEAYRLAKRMDRRLREYRADWDTGFWDAFVSPEHAVAQREAHETIARYGVHGYRWTGALADVIDRRWSILDYGCGKGALGKALRDNGVCAIAEYDPGIPGKDALPSPADYVVCTDVLPFVERDRLDDVIAHIVRLAIRGGFIAVPFHSAEKIRTGGLPYINEAPEWWRARLAVIPGVRFEMLTGEGRTPYLLARWSAE